MTPEETEKRLIDAELTLHHIQDEDTIEGVRVMIADYFGTGDLRKRDEAGMIYWYRRHEALIEELRQLRDECIDQIEQLQHLGDSRSRGIKDAMAEVVNRVNQTLKGQPMNDQQCPDCENQYGTNPDCDECEEFRQSAEPTP